MQKLNTKWFYQPLEIDCRVLWKGKEFGQRAKGLVDVLGMGEWSEERVGSEEGVVVEWGDRKEGG